MPRRLNISDEQIRGALERADGVRSAAAHLLGISPQTLRRRLASDPTLRISQAEIEIRQNLAAFMAIYDAAMAGDVHAQIWILKRFGWGRKVNTPQPAPRFLDPGSFTVVVEPSPAETGEPIDELERKRKSRP